jgi:hypothetical protein
VEWVRQQLTGFVGETRPINQSGNGLITARTAPECGRARAIELVEVVRPILRRLYPEWESENPGSNTDEFKSERDASRRLLARLEHLPRRCYRSARFLPRLRCVRVGPRLQPGGLPQDIQRGHRIVLRQQVVESARNPRGWRPLPARLPQGETCPVQSVSQTIHRHSFYLAF